MGRCWRCGGNTNGYDCYCTDAKGMLAFKAAAAELPNWHPTIDRISDSMVLYPKKKHPFCAEGGRIEVREKPDNFRFAWFAVWKGTDFDDVKGKGRTPKAAIKKLREKMMRISKHYTELARG